MTRCTEIIVNCHHNELAIIGLALLGGVVGYVCCAISMRTKPGSTKP